MTFDALVLNASLRQALVTVRSLGRRGLRVAAAAHVRKAPAFSSRWCRHGFLFPPEEATEAYLETLEQWLDTLGAGGAGGPTIIPSHDGTIALLRRHRDRLGQRARLALADEPALAIAVNKELTSAVAKRLGLLVPREALVRGVDDVPAAIGEIGLPAVIKPCESWLSTNGNGTRVAPELVITADETRAAVARTTEHGGTVLLQQLLTGRREAVSFLYARGEFYARFAQWARRTHPPLGGASVLRQSIAIPSDIGRQAKALIREIDLEGYSEVEFRRDSSGVPHLMEINPRLSASVEIAVRAGVDFPSLLYQWASGSSLAKQNGYRVGRWMRHLGGDIETMVDSIQQRGRPGISRPVRTVVDFGTTFFKPMSYDYFDWQDPLPAVSAATGFVRTTFRRLRSRMRKVFQ